MAALDVAAGKVMGQLVERHRSEEFLACLDHVADGVEPGTDVRVVLDSVYSHKSAMVNEWLKDRPNWTFHFTPTPASWTNAVEGFFSKLAMERPKFSSFNPAGERIALIEGYIEHQSANGNRPFRCSKEPVELVEARKKGHQRLQEAAS